MPGPHFRLPKVQIAAAGLAAAVALAVLVPISRPDTAAAIAAESAVRLPPPTLDPASPARSEIAIFAGGCFWGVQGVFQHVKGVTSAVSGYAGGTKGTASYDRVSTGATGHAEAVRITFDPRIVSYGTLLRIHFSVVHDPTQLNRQGPDRGTQYRSAIVPVTAAQRQVAAAYIAQLGKAKAWPRPIVTRIEPDRGFYPAEAYHQDYLTRHPDQFYIRVNDLPKITALSREFPALYRAKPVLVGK
ncbi:peptide-methionine (S)-S-oxide reductase [Sphingomonas laterariae]|uniref:Peptide methionine sulfoxide reductase MsrA n=1 Tax=Edaphosphingomonas laterariae TaxID=861865 RepID=A0A239FXV9_9SPHN|nr:peptide-methionine (S)-S-oxide reductase MsrA [Sphingomonas laterariae]SNS61585.1 peptide-methionine (S)-S-oxide reductase [Sphingomonas laterariae]